uniref:Uncharacterized protein n=1 Tax=Arundo donax TaxID=35708 RepID=A0A0A9A6G5_ARUDO
MYVYYVLWIAASHALHLHETSMHTIIKDL